MKNIDKNWFSSKLCCCIIVFLILVMVACDEDSDPEEVAMSKNTSSENLILDDATGETIDDSTSLNTKFLNDLVELDTLWSEQRFYRSTGKPIMVKELIGNGVDEFEQCFWVVIKNGEGNELDVNSAVIKIDGNPVAEPSDFSNKNDLIIKEICTLNTNSYLEVELRGKPGSYLDICILGKLKDALQGYLILSTWDGIYKVDYKGNAEYLFSGKFVEILGSSIFTQDNDSVKEYTIDGTLLHTTSIYTAIPAPSEPGLVKNFNVLPNGGFAFLDNEVDKVYFIDNEGNLLQEVAMPNVTSGGDGHLQNVHGVIIDGKLVISENGNKEVFSISLDDYSTIIYKDLNCLDGWLNVIDYYNGKTYICQAKKVYSFGEGEAPQLITTFTSSSNIGGIVKSEYDIFISLGSQILKVNENDGTHRVFSSDLLGATDIELMSNSGVLSIK
jgi:hypothetical protein